MASAYKLIALEAINVILASLAMAYLVLVFLGYVTEGGHYAIRLDARRPVMTAKRLLVGMGVRFAAQTLRIGQRVLDPLFEASAEVGDWFADHSSQEVRDRIRSRFI